MDIEYAKSLSYSKLRSIYKSYLKSLDLSKNSIATMSVDTFYLWNNGSQQLFWDVVTADDFDNIVRDSIKSILAQKATGSIDSRLSSYVSYLKKFRDYLFSDSLPLQEPEKDNATYLKEFLLDIDCLDPLSEWTSKFNLFDILKISRTEIRHSNMLSWLLNPNENHGLSDSILRGFIQYVVTNFSDDSDVFDTLLY